MVNKQVAWPRGAATVTCRSPVTLEYHVDGASACGVREAATFTS